MRKLAVLLVLSSGTFAFAGVSVSAPANGITVSSPVQYVASASSSCSKGISAMGVYTGAGQLVYTTQGAKLNTLINLNPGVYNTVVEEWDNCGGASVTPVKITVGSGSQVVVSVPKANSTVSSTVQYVASANSSCSKGVSAIGIYTAPGQLAYTSQGAQLNTTLTLKPGVYDTVVQAWDNCGGSSRAPVTITVGGSSDSGVFTNLHQQKGWTGYALLPPLYNICNSCTPAGPQATWSMTQNISSPSLSGNSSLMDIGGETDYADILWNNHLIGNFSSQGMPDNNQTIVPNLHNFTYDVYFYVEDLSVSQALEFDINQFVGGYSYIWGHECRIAGGNEWDIWDNPGQKWLPTGVACKPLANAWNHLVLQVQRTSDNHILFQSITLNGVTSTLNYYEEPTTTTWYGVTVNYQQDGNYAQTPYSVWLDKLNFAYW
jgi:hypothetical protein